MATPERPEKTPTMVVYFIIAVLFFTLGSLVYGVYVVTNADRKYVIITENVTVTHNVLQLDQYDLCFSPEGTCSNRIISNIDAAEKSIHILAYSFTSDPIGAALIRAKQNGRDVKVIFDAAQSKGEGSELSRLIEAGIEVRVDNRTGLMHNKVIIIDQAAILTGSYNYSENAESNNRENLLLLKDINLAAQYEANFQAIWEASQTP